MEHAAFGVSEEEIGHPDHGEMVVVEGDALVVVLLVREAGVPPRLSQVHVH